MTNATSKQITVYFKAAQSDFVLKQSLKSNMARTRPKEMKTKSIWRQTVKNYASRSSIQGVPYVVESQQSLIGRIFWSLVVLVAVTIRVAL